MGKARGSEEQNGTILAGRSTLVKARGRKGLNEAGIDGEGATQKRC